MYLTAYIINVLIINQILIIPKFLNKAETLLTGSLVVVFIENKLVFLNGKNKNI